MATVVGPKLLLRREHLCPHDADARRERSTSSSPVRVAACERRGRRVQASTDRAPHVAIRHVPCAFAPVRCPRRSALPLRMLHLGSPWSASAAARADDRPAFSPSHVPCGAVCGRHGAHQRRSLADASHGPHV
eukprot:439850-Prymnesium_polylepis.1